MNTCRQISYVKNKYPKLVPLVERGVLKVVTKPRHYDESGRRKIWLENNQGQEELREPNEIWMLGTSHLSTTSAEEVQKVIESLEPEAVVVELCKKRSGILADKHIEKQEDTAVGNIMQKYAEMVQKRIGSRLNVMPGLEFKQASLSAKAVGAQLVLGDRPIDITLRRCWAGLSFAEKMKLILAFMSSALHSDYVQKQVQKQINAIEEENSLDMLFEQVSKEFPGLMNPLFTERDRYMAWALKRSKAVTNCNCVVGIMGRGHLSSVLAEIEKDYERKHLSFKSVAKLDEKV